MQSSSDNPPQISFILPTLNAETLLDNCLASIARQSYPYKRHGKGTNGRSLVAELEVKQTLKE